MNKYKLTENKKEVFGTTLYQIETLKDFRYVSKGDLGGWIEKESNLSQEGNAWVFDDAQVSGNARVYDDAWVSGSAWVYGNARVYDDARVYNGARVYDDAWVSGSAWVYGNAKVCDDTLVSGNALVSGNTLVSGNARVFGDEKVMGSRTEKENIKYSNKQLQKTKQLNNSSDNIKTNKEKISMLQSLTNALKRNLSPASQKLYKAGLINGGLELTEKGSEELNDVLYAKHEKELVERAEEIIAEEKKKK